MVVYFDKPLIAGLTDLGNWRTRFNNIRYFGSSTGTIVGPPENLVVCLMAEDAPELGPNVCSYAADPPDVVGTDGLAVAPFDDFPVAFL